MASFISRLLGKSNDAVPRELAGLRPLEPGTREKSGRREPPTELDWSRAEYIPLPPSPPTWEVDGRDKFHTEYNNPAIKPVYEAAFQRQHTKVVRLAAALSAEHRQGGIGKEIAKAYRKLIIQGMKAGQLAAAAKRCIEMFEMVPGEVQDVDRRRFNRVLNQLDKAGKKHSYTPAVVTSGTASQPLFTITNSTGWDIVEERKLQTDEKPDPAFRIVAIGGSGTWLLDRSGSSIGKPEVKSVLRRLDGFGQVVGDKPLEHDVYRTGTNPVGSNIAMMDSDGGLYIYDAALKLLYETKLRDDPRVVDHFRTIDTEYWGEFKSQIRVVDVAPEGDRYLFTLADEAWCCTLTGRSLWGVAMPLKKGWEGVVGRTERYGVGHEVEEALRLFELSLPVEPAEINRKRRMLAMAHHPDRNPDDPRADEKMKALNRAFEILTGVDPNTLGFEESDVTHFARTEPDQVIEMDGFRITMTFSGGTPQDWVYAASFSASDGRVFVATYSGKVILLSHEGRPIIVYDLGTCPNEIVDVGRYTYFLTNTRLYVVEDRKKLAAFLDVFQEGRLFVTESGFGLLASKNIKWFTASGSKVGELSARDPIRTVHKTTGNLIVKTRQHQVEVRGPGL